MFKTVKIRNKWAIITFATVGVGGAIIWKEVFPSDTILPSSVSRVLETNSNPYLYLETKLHQWSEEHHSHQKWEERRISWLPWLRVRSDDPWTLLRIARSSNHAIRVAAVQSLASKHHWKSHQYRQVAQACDYRTLIGLARTSDSDRRFFLPPPELPMEDACITDQFRDILTALPQAGVNPCVQHFTASALHHGHAAEENKGFWYFDGTGLEFFNSLSEVPVEKVEKISLEALAAHSTVADHRPKIVEHNGLQLLQRLQLNGKSFIVKRLIARIIGNLAVDQTLHYDILRAGWVGLLADWIHSVDLCLSMHATRALRNLDLEFGGKTFEDGVYLVHPRFRSNDPIYADVVFVHGLLGGPFVTWRQGEVTPKAIQEKTERVEPGEYSYCWPKDWLAVDCPHLRILSVEYESNLSDWTARCPWESKVRSLRIRSINMLHKLKKAGLGKRPIIWIGHSMGGLLIKKIIEESCGLEGMEEIRANTKGFVFYSVPHRGSELASLSKQAAFLLYPSPEVKELSTDSPMLRSLHARFVDFVSEHSIQCLSFGELKTTELGMAVKSVIVPPESSDPGVGEYHPIHINHMNICKPFSRLSPVYQLTLSFIHRCVPETMVDNILMASLHEETFGEEFVDG